MPPARSFLRALREESKPTGGKVTIHRDLIERGGSSEAWYEGETGLSARFFVSCPGGAEAQGHATRRPPIRVLKRRQAPFRRLTRSAVGGLPVST